MANGTRSPPAFPSGATPASAQQLSQQQLSQQQQQLMRMSGNGRDLARVKQQVHAAATGAPSATQLQQRAAAAAQFLSAERKISSREIQAMLEKNDASLRGWNVLHTQEPPKTLVKEHKDWVRKCMTYRQQVGARLEVLASLADKQIAIEDESSDRVKKVKTQQESRNAAPVPAPAAAAPQTASKKSKASAALARQAAHNRQKTVAVPVPAQRAAPATIDSSSTSSTSMQLPVSAAAPIPSPTSFPEPPMPMASPANPQQYGYPTAAFYGGANQSSAMTSAGFSDGSMNAASAGADLSSAQAFPMNSAYMNAGDPSSTMAFMNQQNFMMNPAMNMAMMNPQYLAMQMQMQSQMPMNMATGAAAGMYGNNPQAMFNSYSGMGSNQLPADPFNTSFNQQAFSTQPQFNPVTGGFDGMAGMQSAAMMNQMSTFPMMPDQIMMNAFPYGMSMPQQQQQLQQQQLQQQQQQFQNPGTSSAQAFAMPQQPQQPQQQQPQQDPQQDPQTSVFPESSLFDDAVNSNLFDGFPEDAFLLEM